MKYNNSRRAVITPLLVAAGVAAGILAGVMLGGRDSGGGIRSVSAPASRFAGDKITNVLTLIRSQYVDAVDMDTIAEKVIPEIVKELDPHSSYIPAMDLAELNDPLEGQFDGIGVTFNMLTDTVLVLNVIAGGPSAKAGVMAGDRIITIDDSVVAGVKMDQDDVVRMLRGHRGTKVTIGVERAGRGELLPIGITRGVIPIKSLDAAFMATDKIGYVRLSRFSRNSHRELIEAVDGLKERGMEKLIFDLRDNNGGLLDQAIYISNELLPAERLIVYTEGRASRRSEQYTNGRGRLIDTPLIVMIDETSASASEIVAGAVQDNDRGTIIGRRSFGKGLVQEQIPFPDGSALRLTVARYYTPVGRSIQKPYDNGNEEYNRELLTRYMHNEFFSADSIHFADSLRFTTPGGKTVYGGGGIMPDIFVPRDTTKYNDYMIDLYGSNLIIRYALDFTDRHRAELNAARSIADLDAFFARRPTLTADFVKYAADPANSEGWSAPGRGGVTPKGAELQEVYGFLEAQLKGSIGRNTDVGDNAYYWYVKDFDEEMAAAVSFFENDGGTEAE